MLEEIAMVEDSPEVLADVFRLIPKKKASSPEAEVSLAADSAAALEWVRNMTLPRHAMMWSLFHPISLS